MPDSISAQKYCAEILSRRGHTSYSLAITACSLALKANYPFLICLVFYLSAAFGLSRIFEFDFKLTFYHGMLWSGSTFLCIVALVGASCIALARHRPHRPILFLKEAFGEWSLIKRLLYGAPVILSLPLFFSAFGAVKQAIPVMVPFYADPYLADLDRLLHGVDAWQILHPVVGYPFATELLNYGYLMWFAVLYIALTYVAFMIRNDVLRSQFIIAYLLCWTVLGTIAAAALSSVGPCYFEAFFGDDRFSKLMSYLQQVHKQHPLTSIATQARLLELQHGSRAGIGAGISAMPSLHVAMSVLVAIFAWRVNKVVGAASAMFAVVIVVGSVHLGWHYAVDGYVAVAGALILWAISGRIAAAVHRGKTNHSEGFLNPVGQASKGDWRPRPRNINDKRGIARSR